MNIEVLHGETELEVGTLRYLDPCPDCGGRMVQRVEYRSNHHPWEATHDWSDPFHADHFSCVGNLRHRIEQLEQRLSQRKTWEEWNVELDARIMDPDGFRFDPSPDGRYTRHEFDLRAPMCTVNVNGGYWKLRRLLHSTDHNNDELPPI